MTAFTFPSYEAAQAAIPAGYPAARIEQQLVNEPGVEQFKVVLSPGLSLDEPNRYLNPHSYVTPNGSGSYERLHNPTETN